MSELIGALATSHGPQLIMPALKWSDLPTRIKGPFNPKPGIEAELTDAVKLAKEARCKAALSVLKDQLYAWNPDLVVVVGDDQHENVQDDNQPPFLIYMAEETDATLHFLYLGDKATDQMARYKVASDVSRRLVDGLMERDFDPAWSIMNREETGLGHAFGRALNFLMPDRRFPIVPIMVNTYYPPAPSAKRCFRFGEALREIVREIPGDKRVVLIASGGLSHTKIDEALDHAFLKALETRDEAYLSAMPGSTLVSGTSEIRNWIITAGAMPKGGRTIDYVPCYRNDQGVGCAMGFAVWQ
jgi:3-O-methylgallate 3,4-dioxygenase